MYYVYIIKKEGKKGYYTGFTGNLKQRFATHSARQKSKLIYYENYLTETLARERELQLKQFGGAWRALRKRLGI